MKPQLWSLLVAVGFVVASAGTVRAEDKPGQATVKSGQTGNVEVRYEGDFNGCRGSKLVGADVKNSAGKDLGKIKDVVVDPQSGRVAYAVLSFGGFMGMGNKLFAIPWSSMQMQADDLVTLDIEKSQLEESMGFDNDHWPNMADQKWATDTHQRFGQKPYWDVDIEVDGTKVDATAEKTVRALQVAKLSEIIGHKIENNMDKNLGDINDVVLDSHRGQIAYAVLGVGGVIGIGEDLVAVPWDKLDVTVVDNDTNIRLAMSETELKNGPHFSKDQWPNTDDKDYLVRVYTFYDTEPYWHKDTKRVSDARDR